LGWFRDARPAVLFATIADPSHNDLPRHDSLT